MIGRTLVFSGGRIDYDFAKEYLSQQTFDSIVCADSGLETARRLKMNVDFFMGDFDSVSCNTLEKYMKLSSLKPDGTRYVRFPKEKDYTDTHLVIDWVVEHEPSEIVILGATGGRLDHFLANLNILMLPLKKRIPAYIIDRYNKICLIDGEYTIYKENVWGKYISLQPLTETVTNVYLHGMKYPLAGETLRIGESRAISNELAENVDKAKILFDSGILVVIEAHD